MPARLIVNKDGADERVWLASEEVYQLGDNLPARSAYAKDVHVKPGGLIRLVKLFGSVSPFGNYQNQNSYAFCCKICCDEKSLNEYICTFSANFDEVVAIPAVSKKSSRAALIETTENEDL